MLYKEVTDHQIEEFLLNKGIREWITVAEVRFIAKRFRWWNYEMYGDGSAESVSRGVILELDYPVSKWQLEASKSWLETNDGSLRSVCVMSGGTLCIEIFKEVDDWWWVVLNMDERDFFYNSPVLNRAYQSNLYYRCDQMSGLLALLEWACPKDKIKK